jgi:uncharacterized OsmC-like protein
MANQHAFSPIAHAFAIVDHRSPRSPDPDAAIEEAAMDANTLRARQAPLKERYRADPAAALIRFRTNAWLEGEGITCRIDRPQAVAVAGLHKAAGGTGDELCSGDMLLEALLACAAVTLRSVATVMDIPIRSGRGIAEGEIDFRGTLGVARDVPVGFLAIRLAFSLDTDAPDAALDKLAQLTDRYCVVSQSLNVRPSLTIRRMPSVAGESGAGPAM